MKKRLLLITLFFLSCTLQKQPLAPEPLLLTNSGTIVLSGWVVWKSQYGKLVFGVVKNYGKRVAVVPVAAAFSNRDSRFIARGRGQLTTKVDRDNHTPTDRIRYLGEGQSLEFLVFVPVEFDELSLVYVEWALVREDEEIEF